MNLIHESRENIINRYNDYSQRELDDILDKLNKTINDLVLPAMHGNIDFSILKTKGFSHIKKMEIAAGEITSISNLPPSLEELICNNQYLIELDNLPPSLRKLECQHNYIDSFDFANNKKLKKIQVSHNKLTSIINLPEELEELYCDHNDVRVLNLRENTHLRVLHCSNNQTIIIENLPESIVDFKSENNPYIEIHHSNEPAHNIDDSTEKVNFIEGINEYFSLKTKYEYALHAERVAEYTKLRGNKASRKKRASEVRGKCIKCHRRVGTIFQIKNRIYTAICGDSAKPCSLNIKIYAGNYYDFDKSLRYEYEILLDLKDTIIRHKLDTLFSYITSEAAAKLFKNNMEEYTAISNDITDLLDKHNKYYYRDPIRIDAIAKKNAVIYGLIDAIKELMIEYEKTGNQQIMETAIDIQIKELNPEIHNLRMLKHEIMEVEHKIVKKLPLLNETEPSANMIYNEMTIMNQRYSSLQKCEYHIGKPQHVEKFVLN